MTEIEKMQYEIKNLQQNKLKLKIKIKKTNEENEKNIAIKAIHYIKGIITEEELRQTAIELGYTSKKHIGTPIIEGKQ